MIFLPKDPLASLPVKSDDDFFDATADIVDGEYEEDSDIEKEMPDNFWAHNDEKEEEQL